MKKLIFTIIAVVLAIAATAADLDSVASLYNAKLYNDALPLLLAAEREQGASSELCYNIGATYYRLNDTPHAVAYFERALLLDPSNAVARQALQVTRERATVSDDAFAGDHYVVATAKQWMYSHSSNTYATMAVICFLLTLALIALYLTASQVRWRKVGFFGAIVALLMCVVLNVLAWRVQRASAGHRFAVLLEQPTRLNAVPRAVTDSADVVLSLKAGTRVWIADSVTAAGQHTWYAIEHPQSRTRQAWIPDTAIIRP